MAITVPRLLEKPLGAAGAEPGAPAATSQAQLSPIVTTPRVRAWSVQSAGVELTSTTLPRLVSNFPAVRSFKHRESLSTTASPSAGEIVAGFYFRLSENRLGEGAIPILLRGPPPDGSRSQKLGQFPAVRGQVLSGLAHRAQ